MIQGNRVLAEALEILLALPDGRGPQHTLVRLFEEQQVGCGEDLRVDMDRPFSALVAAFAL